MDEDYPGIFELTPFERWVVDEMGKSFRRFRKRAAYWRFRVPF